MRMRKPLCWILLLELAIGVAPARLSLAQDEPAAAAETETPASTENNAASSADALAAPPTVEISPNTPEVRPATEAAPQTEAASAASTATDPAIEPTTEDSSKTPDAAVAAPVESTTDTTPTTEAPQETAAPAASEVATDAATRAPLQLSLSDAIAMGIQNNLRLEVERHGPLMAGEEWASLEGVFDPTLYLEGGYRDLDRPVATALDDPDPTKTSVNTQQWSGESGLRGIVPWLGADYKIAYTAARAESDSNLSRLSPEYRTNLYGELSIPLLRNLIWNEPWTAVHTARSAYQAESERFRGALMDTVLEIETAYWDLIATAEKKRVAEKSLETARALLRQTEIQYEVGVIARVEVTEAKAGVAEREVNLIRAENTYHSTQDKLLHLTMAQELRASPALAIEPTDALDQHTPYAVDLEVAIQKANENRPQLAASQYDIRRLEFMLKHAKNQRLPQLDVSGRYGYEGLAGEPKSTPVAVPDNYSESHDDYFHNNGHRQWSTRGTFSIPLGNRTASHQVSKTEYELRRAKTQHRYIEQQVVLEVRDAARNLQSAIQGIEAAERRREAAEEQLRAEKFRLENGESTPFDVLQRERDLVTAESEKISALQLYRNSDASLDHAQGTILKNRNIRIEEAGALH